MTHKRADLTHFTLIQGGDWLPIQQAPFFALRFSDDYAWDRLVGWRRTSLVSPPSPASEPQGSAILRRDEAARYLNETFGIPCARTTLAKYAWDGTGPVFRKAGKTVLYAKSDLDSWAKSRLGPLTRGAKK